MVSIKLIRGDSYTLVPTIFEAGRVYAVSEELADVLLAKVDDFGIAYFQKVGPGTSVEEEEEPAEVEQKPTKARKIVV